MRIQHLAALALLAACAAPAAGPGAQRSSTVVSAGTSTGTISTTSGDEGSRVAFAAPADQVWLATQLAYAAMGIDAGVLEREGWIYGNRRLVATRIAGDRASRLVSCGTGPFGAPAADSYEVSFSIASSVEPTADGTQVLTWMTATAKPRGASGNTVQCTSRGRLEARLNAEIAARLAAGDRREG